VADIGAVHLYRPDGTLISTLRGSQPGDLVGQGGVQVLSNGNFVALSQGWNNGSVVNAGAATWVSGRFGLNGTVSASNSLVSTDPEDGTGFRVVPLSNGNYVVSVSLWNSSRGAVAWGSGSAGVRGAISASNALVGSTAADQVGSRVLTLPNGNYVVGSPAWNGFRGAATFGSGSTGVVGVISAGNSLVGGTASDFVGNVLTLLSNGDYVMSAPRLDHAGDVDAGAVTWGSGSLGVAGVISASNSLVGNAPNQFIGINGITPLTNGAYVISSPSWNSGSAQRVGAATWARGDAPSTGTVSSLNSVRGSTTDDEVGASIVALANGNYVVVSNTWDSGANANVGATTFGSGATGLVAVVSATNSLVGSTPNDGNSQTVTALANGNYVVTRPEWNRAATVNAGAVTWVNGATGLTGLVSESNSLIGSTPNDRIGTEIVALGNGHYVIGSPLFNETEADVGAATWVNGDAATVGTLSLSNSLLGAQEGDRVGAGLTALTNDHYLVRSPQWRAGSAASAGAVTWGNGASGIVGRVSASNSLLGARANDEIGAAVQTLVNGNYVIHASQFDRPSRVNAGAAIFGAGNGGTNGAITLSNALLGDSTEDRIGESVLAFVDGRYALPNFQWDGNPSVGATTFGRLAGTSGLVSASNSVLGLDLNTRIAYDPDRLQMIVAYSTQNRMVLFRPGSSSASTIVGDAPDPSIPGQPAQFRVQVSTAGGAPTLGRVVVSTVQGESCESHSGTAINSNTAEYVCAIAFAAAGNFEMRAEFFGSESIDYSLSGAEPHRVLDLIFGNGFQ
jgi:hypothetical protein